jgi:uncharacterized protein
MNLLFIINTPAQAYTWRYIITQLQKKQYSIGILARDYGSTPELLDSFGFKYVTFKPVGSRVSRFAGSFEHLRKCYSLSKQFSPSIVIGFGVDAAVTAALQQKPCVVFVDDETTDFQNRITYMLSSIMVTPNTFTRNLGKKHVPINSYKELAYLYPTYFNPDPKIYDELGIKRDDKYVILRFNVFDAIHDIHARGFSVSNQCRLAKELSQYARVFVSHEGNLPEELADLRLPIATNRMHHALYYAQLLVTDTQTMTTEAAILGTPVVRSNSFVATRDMHVFTELEQKYDLIYSLGEAEPAIEKAKELMGKSQLKEQWAAKREKLIADKIDCVQFMIESIERCLEGRNKIKYQEVTR